LLPLRRAKVAPKNPIRNTPSCARRRHFRLGNEPKDVRKILSELLYWLAPSRCSGDQHKDRCPGYRDKRFRKSVSPSVHFESIVWLLLVGSCGSLKYFAWVCAPQSALENVSLPGIALILHQFHEQHCHIKLPYRKTHGRRSIIRRNDLIDPRGIPSPTKQRALHRSSFDGGATRRKSSLGSRKAYR
jgi:hypothetical protein